MLELDHCLPPVLVLGLALGAWSVLSARTAPAQGRMARGRRLFVVVLLAFSGGTALAAVCCPEYVVPSGLCAAGLLLAMLWEAPRPALKERQLLSD